MIFMGADSVEGNLPLDKAVEHDLAEIERVAGSPTLDVFVEVHNGDEKPYRQRFGFDTKNNEKTKSPRTPAPDAAAGLALPAFIRESILASEHRPEDHSLLVLWGHAYNFAFGRSRTRSGVVDALDFHELSTILRHLQEGLRAPMGAEGGADALTLDIVGFDACEVATVEMAYQLQPFAKYLLGSQVGIPIPGWPYDRILDRLAEPEGRLMVPAEFGSYAVRRFCESYEASDPTSLTMIDLSRVPELKSHAELLALTLVSAIGDPDTRDRVVELFYRSQTAEGRTFVDVADLCLSLMRESGDTYVSEAARALGDFLVGPRPLRLIGRSETGEGRPLIIEHGRNAGELARLHGISLYAPHVAPDDDAVETQFLYDSFAFAQETRWSMLVRLLAQVA
jgi:hypothetical protein